MQHSKRFITYKHTNPSLFYLFTLIISLTTLSVHLSNNIQNMNFERVRLVKDRSGEDLFASFEKMKSNSIHSTSTTVKIESSKFVSVKHSGGKDSLDSFLNVDSEVIPKLMLENLTQMRAGLNVMMKKAKKKKKHFVINDSKGDQKPPEEIRLIIRSWLGKELFNNLKNSKVLKRSNSNVDSHVYNKFKDKKGSGVNKINSFIEIDSKPKTKESYEKSISDSVKVYNVFYNYLERRQ